MPLDAGPMFDMIRKYHAFRESMLEASSSDDNQEAAGLNLSKWSRAEPLPSLLVARSVKAVVLPAEMYKDERNKYLEVAQRLKLATGPYQVG